MGNHASCALASSGSGVSDGKEVKVVLPGGEIRRYQEHVQAAELMLEEPNTFLVSSQFLHLGRRISALAADEDLEMGGVYVLFPIHRLNSFVTTSDMGSLYLAVNSVVSKKKKKNNNKNKRSSGGGAKVSALPDVNDASFPATGASAEANVPRLKLEEIEGLGSPAEFKHRMSMCRSRKPVLETIVEEPICTR